MNRHLTIKDLPEDERPYEKLQKNGPERLSDAELLAIILRTGTKDERVVEMSQRLLKEHNGLFGLFKISIFDLQKIKGIGRVKAIQIKAVYELVKRISRAEHERAFKLDNPRSIANYYMSDLKFLQSELCKVVLVDSKSHVIKDMDIFLGSDDKAALPLNELFRTVIKEGAVGIVLLHNHPSGNPAPSKADVEATNIIKANCDMLSIKLIDHIIIGNNDYISFKENSLL